MVASYTISYLLPHFLQKPQPQTSPAVMNCSAAAANGSIQPVAHSTSMESTAAFHPLLTTYDGALAPPVKSIIVAVSV